MKMFSSLAFTNVMTAQEKVETTFLGGANADYGQAIAIDNIGNVFLVGKTWSNDYPTTIDAYATSQMIISSIQTMHL